jgi:hypothetical protein
VKVVVDLVVQIEVGDSFEDWMFVIEEVESYVALIPFGMAMLP